MNSPQTRLTLLGIALGVFLALLLAPQTRWLLRFQALPPPLFSRDNEAQKKQFVQGHSDDYLVQLAGQTDYSAGQTQIEYARSLVPRFPENASLRANLLRYAMLHTITLRRDESDLLEGAASRSVARFPEPSTPAQLAAFEADAAAGERLDPDNAYFPLMRSIGLFAAHRDADALAAVRRAARKHLWREYYEDEAEGHWRINDAVYGGREAVSAMAVSASVLFPQYSSLRQVARIVTYKAVLQEQAGRSEAGLTLRRQVMRCGDLMRVQSTSLIGNLVGNAICGVARSRPGGIPPDHAAGPVDEGRGQKRLEAYCVYVTRLGHPEDAAAARAQFEGGERLRHQIIGDHVFGSRMADLTRLAVALMTGWVLFPSILALLLLGLTAAGLCRLPQVRARRPLPAGSAFGVWVVLLAAVALAALFAGSDPGEFPFFAAALLLTPLLLAGLAAWLLPGLRGPLRQSFRVALLTLAALGLLGGLTFWQMQGGGETLMTWRQTLSGGDVSGADLPEEKIAQLQALLGLAFGLAIPALLAFGLSIAARVRRVPVSVGLAEGFRAAMPPLVCLLMLSYGGLTLWMARQEARVNYGLERSLHGEGQYLAELSGQPWPEPIRL